MAHRSQRKPIDNIMSIFYDADTWRYPNRNRGSPATAICWPPTIAPVMPGRPIPVPRTFAVLMTGMEILYRELAKPGKFSLGQVLLTPGATEALFTAQQVPPEFLLRHVHGDWGELCAEDRRENARALRVGSRLLSAYQTRSEAKLWVITEWDRSATTLLLPAEY